MWRFNNGDATQYTRNIRPTFAISPAYTDFRARRNRNEFFDDDEARAVLRDAHRILAKGGLVCLTSLGRGQTPLSRLVCGLWNRIYAWRPSLVGGCRPIALRACLPPSNWIVIHHSVTVRWGVPCEVVVAERV